MGGIVGVDSGVVVVGCWQGLVLPEVGVVVMATTIVKTKAVGAVLLNRVRVLKDNLAISEVLGMVFAFQGERCTVSRLGKEEGDEIFVNREQ